MLYSNPFLNLYMHNLKILHYDAVELTKYETKSVNAFKIQDFRRDFVTNHSENFI